MSEETPESRSQSSMGGSPRRLRQVLVLRALSMKTITISDETYRRLESIKDGRSFSETTGGLIRASASKRIDRLLELASSEQAEKTSRRG